MPEPVIWLLVGVLLCGVLLGIGFYVGHKITLYDVFIGAAELGLIDDCDDWVPPDEPPPMPAGDTWPEDDPDFWKKK